MTGSSCIDLSKEMASMLTRYSIRVFSVVMILVVVALLPDVASAGNSGYRTLYRFQGGSDGWGPVGVPAVDKEGNLYGVTNMGGAHNLGTVYRMTAPQSPGGKWTKAILYEFPGNNGGGYPHSIIFG